MAKVRSKVLTSIEIILEPEGSESVRCLCTRSYSGLFSKRNWRSENEYSKEDSYSEEEDSSGQYENSQFPKEQTLLETDIPAPTVEDHVEYTIIDEREAMAALGLPTQFGGNRKTNKNHRTKSRIGKSDFAKFVLPNCDELCNQSHRLASAGSELKKFGYFFEPIQQLQDITTDQSANTSKINEEVNKILTEISSEEFESAEDDQSLNIHRNENETNESDSSKYDSCKDNIDIITNSKKKKKGKKKRPLPDEIVENKHLIKYYQSRYKLFSLFDRGIRLDAESWFSVTPECIAKHIAKRLKCDIIIDAFCGAGGNTIQFAKTCKKVIAIDIDPKKIELATHNSSIYGVSEKIEFIIGDFLQLAKTLKGDVVFLSPPWGGPDYKSTNSYDLEKNLQPLPVSELYKLSSEITENIAMFLPKNSYVPQLIRLAGVGGKVELEQNYNGNRHRALTAYYGNLVAGSNI